MYPVECPSFLSRLIKDVITFYLHEDNLSRRLTPPPLPLRTSHSPRDVYSGPLIPRTLPLDRNLFSSPFILQRQTHWDRCRGIVADLDEETWMEGDEWSDVDGATRSGQPTRSGQRTRLTSHMHEFLDDMQR